MLLPNLRSSQGRTSEAPRSTGSRRRRHRFAPDLLALEARALLSTLTVMNDNDSGSGSLRYELGVAKPNDIVDFSPKAYGTITLTSGPLQVPNGVDVQGPGASKVAVSGDDESTVFEIDDGVTASISGLTITDGSATTGPGLGSGGILNYGALTLSDVVISGNSDGSTAAFGGGGVSNAGTLTLTGCTISGNTGGEGGGMLNFATLTIADSTISGNTSTSYTGAGAGILSYASLSLTRCVVSGNAGVGLSVKTSYFYPTSTLTVTDSAVVNNTNDQNSSIGRAYGAGISASAAAVTITGSLIANNTAEGSVARGGGIFMINGSMSPAVILTMTDSTISGNKVVATMGDGNAYGGGIDTNNGVAVTVGACSFFGNGATGNNAVIGGAMDLLGLASSTISGSASSTITYSQFTNNQAVQTGVMFFGRGEGGAIADIGAPPSSLTINGSTFSGNLAQGNSGPGFGLGGAIFTLGGAALGLSSDLFAGNRAVGGSGASPAWHNAAGVGLGGALCTEIGSFGTATEVSDSTFIDNSATGGAATGAGNEGGIGEGGAIQASASVTVSDSTFIGNTAVGDAGSGGAKGGNGLGGAIQSGYAMLKVSGTAIIANSATGGSGGGDGDGGGVAVSGNSGSAALTGVLISLNSATGGSGGGHGYGGGLYIATGAITTLTNTQVVANHASTAGNNIYGTPTSG